MTHIDAYIEHLEFLVKQKVGADAELQGYRDAKEFDKLMQYSKDPFQQDRYATGYFDGQAKILFGRTAKCDKGVA